MREDVKNVVTLNDFPKTIHLEKEFRNLMFCICYKNSGESLRQVAISIGYPSRPGLNARARDMWLGRKGIPRHRIEKLSTLSGISLNEIYKYMVSKENNVLIDDWVPVYGAFKRRHSSKPK